MAYIELGEYEEAVITVLEAAGFKIGYSPSTDSYRVEGMKQ